LAGAVKGIAGTVGTAVAGVSWLLFRRLIKTVVNAAIKAAEPVNMPGKCAVQPFFDSSDDMFAFVYLAIVQ